MFIRAASTISHQPTFRNNGFSSKLEEVGSNSEILHPDYNSIIPIMIRRRMSDVLKMAIACAKDCMTQATLDQPDAIIVGTSMGCNYFTRLFLDKIITSNGSLIAPTAFIVSTHNTIAGQISLLMENFNYNITHSHNSLSFEQALIDSILSVKDGCANVLVGAADESENELYNMKARLNNTGLDTTCGASFFIISPEAKGAGVRIMDVASFALVDNIPGRVTSFLRTNDLNPQDVDVMLYCCNTQSDTDKLTGIFGESNTLDYLKMSGSYFTNSAFALHYATDMLLYGEGQQSAEAKKTALICNNFIPENLGLILICIEG